ncbi:flavin reductase family protein [Tissierella creatinini]|nr:flavin reductase family protein [Tissierella creatinini]TJX66038.1 flavin reductase family protein [Soehngenia saccharolytica]
MTKDIKYNWNLELVLDQIRRGAFLTVKSGEETNTMTIGWASFGVIWNKPILMVMVRKSRHSYEIIERSDNFTVSVPLDKDLKKALAYCGTYSGRDVNKFKEMNLTLKESKTVETPIIRDCNYNYECKIVFKQNMNPKNLHQDILQRNYPIDDFHTLYFGEIVESYLTD